MMIMVMVMCPVSTMTVMLSVSRHCMTVLFN